MKRSIRIKNKKAIIAIVALLGVAAASATGFIVYAYSHNNSIIHNDLTVATSGVRIIEDSVPGFGKKEISFKNEGDAAATVLLRIAYSETWTKQDGTVLSNVASNSANVVTKTWTNAFVQDFADGNDGWYYYKKLLEPGDEVKVITQIALNDQSYEIYNYDLSFRFESVQADATAASSLWGKTATINTATGAVTWGP